VEGDDAGLISAEVVEVVEVVEVIEVIELERAVSGWSLRLG
jgi:hypothetical protein